MSENAIKKVTECTILPHHVDNVGSGDHLPVKVKIKIRCMPSSNEHNNDFSDDVICKKHQQYYERVRQSFHELNVLYSINDGRKFWNIIRKNRILANNDPSSDIALFVIS